MIYKTTTYHILTIFFLLQYTSVVNGDEKQKAERGTVEFFEKIYNIKISGVKPIEEYSDPDQFFTSIARQVGIPKLAFKAVEEKYGWKASEDVFLNAVVKGSPVDDDWGIMIFKFDKKSIEKMQKDKAAGKPISKDKMGIEMKFVVIDYDGKITFPEEKKKEKVPNSDKN